MKYKLINHQKNKIKNSKILILLNCQKIPTKILIKLKIKLYPVLAILLIKRAQG